jgi:HD-GYP domain-containing protein (c-di-GMP phosphodiesterase class II)
VSENDAARPAAPGAALRGSAPEARAMELERENARLQLLLETAQCLGSSTDLATVMKLVIERTSRIMDCERSSVFLLDAEKGELFSVMAQGLDTREIRIPWSTGVAGYVARTNRPLNVPDAYACPHFNREVDRQTGYRTTSVLALPLPGRKGDVLGVIQCLNKRGAAGESAVFQAADEHFLGALGALAAIFLENAKLYRELDVLLGSMVAAFSRAIDDRDPCTSGHTRRVTELALRLARAAHECQAPALARVSYSRERYRQLSYAALLHDVGKIGVREHILTKADKLPIGGPEALRLRLELLREARRADLLDRAWRPRGDSHSFGGPTIFAPQNVRQARERALGIGVTVPPKSAPRSWEEEFAPYAAAVERALALVAAKNKPGPVSPAELAELEKLRARGWLTDDELQCLAIQRGNLTPAELRDMQSHVQKSHEMLRHIPWPKELREVPEVAYSHHEKRDGGGYPRGLKADAIHFDGQVLAIADIYDALVATDRPYKKSVPHAVARRILEDEALQKHTLNADLVKLFFEKECYRLPEYGEKRKA